MGAELSWMNYTTSVCKEKDTSSTPKKCQAQQFAPGPYFWKKSDEILGFFISIINIFHMLCFDYRWRQSSMTRWPACQRSGWQTHPRPQPISGLGGRGGPALDTAIGKGFAKIKNKLDRAHPTHAPFYEFFMETHHWHGQNTKISILPQNISTSIGIFSSYYFFPSETWTHPHTSIVISLFWIF